MLGALLAGAILIGVLLRDAGVGWLALPLATSAALAALGYRPDRTTAAGVALVVAALGLGYWRADPGTPPPVPPSLTTARSFTGTIQDVPRRYPTHTRATVLLHSPAEARVIAWLPRQPAVAQGDVVTLTGRFSRHRGGADPRSAGELHVAEVAVRGNVAPAWQRLRTRLVSGIVTRIERGVPQPAGPFVAGVLTGEDGGMTATTRQAFRAAGFSHLTAVSGWNVTLVGAVLAAIVGGGRLARRWVLLLHLAGIWAFAYLVGLEPSVTRAALMATLALGALWRGRPRDAVTALAWSAAIMVLVQPAIRHHVGFQLSVASSAALVAVAPMVASRPAWVRLLATPLAAQLAATPLLLHHFGQYSLAAPLGNALVAPLIPSVMAGAVAVVLASLVHPVLADAAGVLAWFPARATVAVAEWCARADWAWDRVPPLRWGGTLMAYAMLAVLYGLAWWGWSRS